MSEEMSTRQLIDDIAIGLVALIVVLSVVGALFMVGQRNAAKVERLTTTCVSHGYGGWNEQRGCFK